MRAWGTAARNPRALGKDSAAEGLGYFPRDPRLQRRLTLPARPLPASRLYKLAASEGTGGRRTSATRGRASSPPLARLPLAPFPLTRRPSGSAPTHSRARCSSPSPPSPAPNMAALKRLSAWPWRCASTCRSGGVWSKVKCKRRRPRSAREQTKPRVCPCPLPCPHPRCPTYELASVAPGPEAPRRTDACLASLLLRVAAFARFCSRFPEPGETRRRGAPRGCKRAGRRLAAARRPSGHNRVLRGAPGGRACLRRGRGDGSRGQVCTPHWDLRAGGPLEAQNPGLVSTSWPRRGRMPGVSEVECRPLPVFPFLAAPHSTAAVGKGTRTGAHAWASSLSSGEACSAPARRGSRGVWGRRHPRWRISVFKPLENLVPPLLPIRQQVVS